MWSVLQKSSTRHPLTKSHPHRTAPHHTAPHHITPQFVAVVADYINETLPMLPSTAKTHISSFPFNLTYLQMFVLFSRLFAFLFGLKAHRWIGMCPQALRLCHALWTYRRLRPQTRTREPWGERFLYQSVHLHPVCHYHTDKHGHFICCFRKEEFSTCIL